jgi:hypothetical protein
MKLFPTFYETPEGTAVAGAVTPPVEPPAIEPEVQPGPWAADLVEYFGDNTEGIAAADRYLREKQQPRMTELEAAAASPGIELWNDLETDSTKTLRDLFVSVYGGDDPDTAAQAAAAFDGLFEQETASTTTTTTPPEPSALSDEDRELIEWARSKRDGEMRESAATEYEQAKAALMAAHPADLTEFDLTVIDPFITATQGDMEAALTLYKEWKGKVAGPVPETQPTKTAPPVLGSEAATAATPPTATAYTKYGQLDDALDNFTSRLAADSAPPVIG